MTTRLSQWAVTVTLMLGALLIHGSPIHGEFAAHSLNERLESEIMAIERAFAKTMADRDHEAFTSFLSEEAVFLGGSVLRGRQAVAEGWRGLFEAEAAPFSWSPQTVEVLDSGNLAISTGPVYDTEGKQFSVYTSIWRQEEPGVWRIVFDRGNKYCE